MIEQTVSKKPLSPTQKAARSLSRRHRVIQVLSWDLALGGLASGIYHTFQTGGPNFGPAIISVCIAALGCYGIDKTYNRPLPQQTSGNCHTDETIALREKKPASQKLSAHLLP